MEFDHSGMLSQTANDLRGLVGFDTSNAETVGDGFGLVGMRERAALVGADLQIESTPGRGTTVIVRVASAGESA